MARYDEFGTVWRRADSDEFAPLGRRDTARLVLRYVADMNGLAGDGGLDLFGGARVCSFGFSSVMSGFFMGCGALNIGHAVIARYGV